MNRIPMTTVYVGLVLGLLIGVVCFQGISKRDASASREKVESPEEARDREERHRRDLELDRRLDNVQNHHRRKGDAQPRAASFATEFRDDGSLELAELEVLLRKVEFHKPAENRDSLYFSETEITNATFAVYLANTGQYRDDAEVEAAEELEVTSTASASVTINDRDSLWHDGQLPDARADHPVSLVTIQQAVEFCDWLTRSVSLPGKFRLPFKREWLTAAYGENRKFPWGNEEIDYQTRSTHPVRARPDLRTPDGLYGMWSNVQELVLSHSDGYGGRVRDDEIPFITTWLGEGFRRETVRGQFAFPRMEYWGYAHSTKARSDCWGFRIVYVPEE